MKQLALYAILLISLPSCFNNSKNNTYIQEKSVYPSMFVNHFPIEIGEKPCIVYSRYNAVTTANLTFELTIPLDSTNYTTIEAVKKNSKANYSAKDTCLNIVDRFFNNINQYKRSRNISTKQKKMIENSCSRNNYPVPNFFANKYVDKTMGNRLFSDFTIFVIEAKSGKYWDEKYLTKGEQMPPEWKNGYSKGIAISEERSVIIYWFIIW